MCGIAGYVGDGDERVLRAMSAAIAHRGPDDSGIFLHQNVGLAHQRLSIVDLSPLGHQPMVSASGKVHIVFNGEIYNFQELRAELESGYPFKGRSDTEVILALYEKYGVACFEKMHGMFAIALFDTRTGETVLARDRMGKKPLFWSAVNGTLIFGSELTALMQHPLCKKKLDMHAVQKYFFYEYVPTPHTLLKHVYKLEPGTYLVWNGHEAKKHTFWKPRFLPKATSFTEGMQQLDEALTSAVSERMVADVPVGVFLSGGLDSSTMAYYAAKAVGKGQVRTFAIGFDEASFDESSYARTVATHLGIEHHEKVVSMNAGARLVLEILAKLDEPMADASIIPTYMLSQFAREHVTVAVGGDGGDELFCGYDTFVAHRLARVYGIAPFIIREYGVRSLVHLLPTSHAYMSMDFKLKKFVDGFDHQPTYRNQLWLSAFGPDVLGRLMHDDALSKEQLLEDVERYRTESDSHAMYDELQFVYERMYMMDQVMVKVDRATMMHALEARAPFLDTRVVELANHMPTNWKFRGLTRKYILKKLMEGKLPHEIIYRKKRGFGPPIGAWLKGDLRPLVEDVLGEHALADIGFLNAAYVRTLVDDHMHNRRDNRKQLWTLLVFALWYRKWMNS